MRQGNDKKTLQLLVLEYGLCSLGTRLYWYGSDLITATVIQLTSHNDNYIVHIALSYTLSHAAGVQDSGSDIQSSSGSKSK